MRSWALLMPPRTSEQASERAWVHPGTIRRSMFPISARQHRPSLCQPAANQSSGPEGAGIRGCSYAQDGAHAGGTWQNPQLTASARLGTRSGSWIPLVSSDSFLPRLQFEVPDLSSDVRRPRSANAGFRISSQCPSWGSLLSFPFWRYNMIVSMTKRHHLQPGFVPDVCHWKMAVHGPPRRTVQHGTVSGLCGAESFQGLEWKSRMVSKHTIVEHNVVRPWIVSSSSNLAFHHSRLEACLPCRSGTRTP